MYTASVSGRQEWPCIGGCLLCFIALRDCRARLLHSCIFSSLWSVVFDLSACLSGFPPPLFPVGSRARARERTGCLWPMLVQERQSNQRHHGLSLSFDAAFKETGTVHLKKYIKSTTLWAILLAKDVRRNCLIFFACLEVTYKMARRSGSDSA